MPESPVTTRFDCPNCGAKYNLVRAEPGPDTRDREIVCRKCGGPLRGREGKYVLKYLLVDRPRVQAAVTRLS
jgi:DNA-directed RNA polymerase subunit RPC12/RpoP